MRRVLSILAVLALFAMLLPVSVGAAQGGKAAAAADKVTVCHSPNGVNPKAITIARSALKAHLAHGDFLVTPTTPCVPRPKQAPNTCTFAASTSQYFAAPVPPATTGALFATGPIRFSWKIDTKAVTGGYWDEYLETDPATKLHNEVTAGTVNGTAVSLTFTRKLATPPDYVFPFSGTLSSATAGPSTLTGTMAGPTFAFTATGAITCNAGGSGGG